MNARPLVLGLFFLSGACGLIYEVVWARQLSLILGVTVFAASTVLAAYMAGLALGSYLIGRFIDRTRNPVRVYALLEGGIGISALAIPAVLEVGQYVYATASAPLEGRFLLFNFLRAIVSFLILLVPTTLMGGTVPVIGRFLVARRDEIGWNVGLLYALNTLGAVIGVVAAGFWLVPEFGLSFATRLAAGINLGIAAILLLARVGEPREEVGAKAAAVEATADSGASTSSAPAVVAAGVFAVSGFAALAYEVIWTRVLVAHVFNTTYAFTTMLAVFLVGLALGDAVLMRAYDRIRRPLFWLGVVQVSIGLSVVVAAAFYVPLSPLSFKILGWSKSSSWQDSVVLMFLRSALVLLPFTLLLGMTFPLVARTVCREIESLGRSLGGIYAANTCGSILGALGAVFVLIPLFGLRGTILLLSAINIVLGGVCWLVEVRSFWSRAALVAVAIGVLMLPPVAIPETIFSDALTPKQGKLLYYHEGVSDTTGVLEWPDGNRIVVYGDARGTAGTHSNRFNRTEAHLAHLLHPRPTRSLQIGFGVGNTLAAAALHPDVQQLDCVELSPQVRDTAGYFWTNRNVLDDPKVRLIIDDGRNYLMRTRTRYHVITLEPPNIYTASVVNLYTKEFYELVSDALTDDGVFEQWISAADMGDEDLKRMVRAVVEVFPETTLWDGGPLQMFPAPTGFLLVIGSKRRLEIDVEALEERMRAPVLREDLREIGIPTPGELLSLFILGPEGVEQWTDDVDPVTDDRTVVDFSTARSLHSGFGLRFVELKGEERRAWFRRLGEIGRLYQRLREPIAPLLAGSFDEAVLEAKLEAQHRVFDRKVAAWESQWRPIHPDS